LPNYDDVRQVNGHKNVSLSNVISSLKMTEAVSFLRDDDQELYKDLLIASFSVQVGIHELLGHGSGKLLREDTLNSFNFDKGMIDPLTGKPVASWYKPGETYDSVFLSLGSAMEECRAESCGIYLSTDRDLLKIFGHFDEVSAQNIIYVNWLNMARAGLVGLEFFSPETGKWRQAHMQARFAILRVLLEAGEGLVKITPKESVLSNLRSPNIQY
jgi:dipeptidyl-peptidase-3